VELSRLSKAPEKMSGIALEIYTEKLRILALQYPQHPDIYAELLILESYEVHPSNQFSLGYAADADAATKIDPGNGFFYAEKAIALLWQGKMNGAIHNLQEASRAPQWDEYSYSRYLDGVKDSELTNGYLNCQNIFNITVPDYANYLDISNHLLDHAIEAERSGNIQGGWRLRKTVRELGLAILRAKNLSSGDASLGLTIMRLSFLAKSDSPLSAHFIPLWKNDRYDLFLAQHGLDAQSLEISNIRNYRNRCKNTLYSVSKNFNGIDLIKINIKRFMRQERIEALLIYGIAFVLALGIFARIIMFFFPQKPGSLSPIVIVIGAILLIFGVGKACVFISDFHSANLPIFYEDGRPVKIENIFPINDLLDKHLSATVLQNPLRKFGNAPAFNAWLGGLLLVQIMIALIAAIAAWKREIAAVPAFVRSLLSSSVFFVSILVIAYLALLPAMLSSNSTVIQEFDKQSRGEIAYLSQTSHITWPTT